MVRRQAMVLALADVFLALTVVFFGALIFTAFMRRPPTIAGGGGGH